MVWRAGGEHKGPILDFRRFSGLHHQTQCAFVDMEIRRLKRKVFFLWFLRVNISDVFLVHIPFLAGSQSGLIWNFHI